MNEKEPSKCLVPHDYFKGYKIVISDKLYCFVYIWLNAKNQFIKIDLVNAVKWIEYL